MVGSNATICAEFLGLDSLRAYFTIYLVRRYSEGKWVLSMKVENSENRLFLGANQHHSIHGCKKERLGYLIKVK